MLARQPGDDGRRYELLAAQRSDGRNLRRQPGRLAVWQPPDGGRATEFAGGRAAARRRTAGRAAARAGREELAGVGQPSDTSHLPFFIIPIESWHAGRRAHSPVPNLLGLPFTPSALQQLEFFL